MEVNTGKGIQWQTCYLQPKLGSLRESTFCKPDRAWSTQKNVFKADVEDIKGQIRCLQIGKSLNEIMKAPNNVINFKKKP